MLPWWTRLLTKLRSKKITTWSSARTSRKNKRDLNYRKKTGWRTGAESVKRWSKWQLLKWKYFLSRWARYTTTRSASTTATGAFSFSFWSQLSIRSRDPPLVSCIPLQCHRRKCRILITPFGWTSLILLRRISRLWLETIFRLYTPSWSYSQVPPVTFTTEELFYWDHASDGAQLFTWVVSPQHSGNLIPSDWSSPSSPPSQGHARIPSSQTGSFLNREPWPTHCMHWASSLVDLCRLSTRWSSTGSDGERLSSS